jgi:hypothetical protein
MTAGATVTGPPGESFHVKSIKVRPFAAAVLLTALTGGGHALADDAKPTPVLKVLRPVASAVVRETVPIKIAPADIPADGYVGVTIDGAFQTARVLPVTSSKNGVIFDWDTKAAYTTPDDPDTQKYYGDGAHTLKIDMFDRSGNVLGEATIPVQVANKIIVPAQGIKLAYHWSPNQQLLYLRQSQLQDIPNTNGGPAPTPQNVEATLIHYSRSVEDSSGSNSLLRDTIQPKTSYLISRGQTQQLAAAYLIKSKYRTVNSLGDVLRELAPLSPGQHIGFSIPVLPNRRVAIGDSWQHPVRIALDWAGTETADVNAESRLDGFEWQNGYPTAKIRETYTGPVTFHIAPAVTSGYGNPNPTATAPVTFDAQTVKYERIVYFAYGSGRLVRTETNIDITADLSPAMLSTLGISGAAGGGGMPGGYSGSQAGGMLGNLLNGDPEDSGDGGGGYQGGRRSPGAMGMSGGGPPMAMGGGYGGYPGGPGGPGYGGPGYGGPSYGGQNGGAPLSTSTKLKLTDITNLYIGGSGDGIVG